MKKTFFEHGIVKLPIGLSKNEVDIINAHINDMLNKSDKFTILYELDGKTPRSIANPHKVTDDFNFIINHPEILHPVMTFLDDDVYVFQLGINLKSAFDGGVWNWHRDFPTYHEEDYIAQPNMVNVLIYLDDFHRGNGSFQYIEGSHTSTLNEVQFSLHNTPHPLRYAAKDDISDWINTVGIQYADGHSGEIRIMHPNVLHASNSNLSNAPRRLITLTYNAISNKAVKRSKRPHLVLDDTDALPIKF
ncbi:hypothetical protein CBF23_002580 [Marinomonas agarivorans]|nr:hypothetical protein CBF23_002580 [Marinomonas agarivorans]